MKAQFATVEAIISLVTVIAAIGVLNAQINNYVNGEYSARRSLELTLATSDFLVQLTHNVSLQKCIQNVQTNNTTCILGYLNYYKKAYGLENFSIVFGNGSISSPNSKCFPYNSAYGKSEICIGGD